MGLKRRRGNLPVRLDILHTLALTIEQHRRAVCGQEFGLAAESYLGKSSLGVCNMVADALGPREAHFDKPSLRARGNVQAIIGQDRAPLLVGLSQVGQPEQTYSACTILAQSRKLGV